MSQPTDTELKQTLARVLPGRLIFEECQSCYSEIERGEQDYEFICSPLNYRNPNIQVLDSELLSLCREVEETLNPTQWHRYSDLLMAAIRDSDTALNGSNIEARYKTPHASWQQRVVALGKVKGVLV